MTNVPLIAQLVERWTVDEIQKSIGRWFKSGSEDIFIKILILCGFINYIEVVVLNKQINVDERYDLQVCLLQHLMTAALSNRHSICNVIVAFENFMTLQVYLQQLLVQIKRLENC
ncbi:hypothetical protein T10_1609 [Trichinella papuae]|uniref:Uncharacterized protein n=1 Tax=Trichinella papuae TaxID=268474 RepID=A0A0V1N282_9BILA|nr:hypothetical protein T10_1609 [Trichinella papuae]